MPHWNAIVCIDWGKHPGKRRAWAADVARWEIAPLDGITTLGAALSWASAQPGWTLIGIDAVLGIPASYFDRARNAIAGSSGVRDFPSSSVDISKPASRGHFKTGQASAARSGSVY